MRDERVLHAIGSVRRESFVPPRFRYLAHRDEPITISHGQATTQPSLVAQMVEAMRLTRHDRVLEVGTGLGYQAAILARLCAEVISIERFDDLAAQAQRNLQRVGVRNVRVLCGDGSQGCESLEPFGAIVVAAAAKRIPRRLGEQLGEGRILVQPIGPGGRELIMAFRKSDGLLTHSVPVVAGAFVPLMARTAEEAPDFSVFD